MTNIEKKFNDMTPEWIVYTGDIFDVIVGFDNKIVRKSSVISEDGIEKWIDIDAKYARPDFTIVSKNGYDRYLSSLNRIEKGLKYEDPFKNMGCKSGWYIEVFGERWHSGRYVRNLSREEHEREVVEAYESGGNRVLILWENDIINQWDEICIPKLEKFTEEARKSINIGEWNIGKREIVNNKVYDSLRDSKNWRILNDEDRKMVIDNLVEIYKNINIPKPDKYMADLDFRRFKKWIEDGCSDKGTRFGNGCCKYYCDSIFDARVSGKRSLREIWKDEEIMRKAIEYQLKNEDGQHNGERFLNAMCFESKFRVISNLNPSLIVKWIKKYGSVKKGSIFYDPCCGFGGRMLAACALGMRYRGIDANKKLVEELNIMARDLKIDAKIIYGDSADKKCVDELLGNEKIDITFTSPPYFDREIYSNDIEQSIIKYENYDIWIKEFLVKMVINIEGRGGIILLNIAKDMNLDIFQDSLKERFEIDDFDVMVEYARKSGKERLIRLIAGNNSTEDIDYVVCKICGRRFRRLKKHLRMEHKINEEEYLNNWPKSKMICKLDSERVSKENNLKKKDGRKYKKRIAYICKDGRIVRRKEACERTWGGKIPFDSIINSDNIIIDKWAGKIEGIDYVRCSICGFKGENIIRHIKKEHDIDGYNGETKSEKHKEKLSIGSNKVWKIRKKTMIFFG